MLICWDRLKSNRRLLALLRGVSVSFTMSGDSWTQTIVLSDGGVESSKSSPSLYCERVPAFELIGSDACWRDLLRSDPPPGWQSVVHLANIGQLTLRGDAREFYRHLHVVSAVVEALRDRSEVASTSPPSLEAHGRYHRVASTLGEADVYVERVGEGSPILAFSTAGGTVRQWHGLVRDTELTGEYELITVDLPWHGLSSPIHGATIGEWDLCPRSYSQFMGAVAECLGLKNSILLGVSMAGAAVVQTIASFPSQFRGAVACQVGTRVSGRSSPLLRATDVSQATLVPEWTYGLMSPLSPARYRDSVWWDYSSGGHGLYASDIDSYELWDFDSISDLLDEDSPHIAILSGCFDTSVPPSASRKLADLIPNSSFELMPDLGHFPHSENPPAFYPYLRRALKRVTQ